MQKKTINSPITSKNISLSIQCSLGGFSFCIKDSETLAIVYLADYSFNTVLDNPNDLVPKLEEIFKVDKNLQQDFNEVFVIHENNLSTLVPSKFFDENKLISYLDYSVKTLATDFIAFDELQCLDAKNVYVPYVNINNYLFQHFGSFEYKHHSSVLIEALIKQNSATEKNMFVHVSENRMDITVLDSKKLLLHNSFDFYTEEDFIYYILFVAEQLQLDTESFELAFIGDIENESKLYQITYQYVRNISFYNANIDLEGFDNTFSNHNLFTLIH